MKKLTLKLVATALATATLPLAGGCKENAAREEAPAAARFPAAKQALVAPLRPVAIPPSLQPISFDGEPFASAPRPQSRQPEPLDTVARQAVEGAAAEAAMPRVTRSVSEQLSGRDRPLPSLVFPDCDPETLHGTDFNYRGEARAKSTSLPPASTVESSQPGTDAIVLNSPWQPEQTVSAPRVTPPLLATSPAPARESHQPQRMLPPAAHSQPMLADTHDWRPQNSPASQPIQEQASPQQMTTQPVATPPAEPITYPATAQPAAPAYSQQLLPADDWGVPQQPMLPSVEVQPLELPLGAAVDMEVVRHHGRMLIQRGTELGERGALYSAKTDFLHAFRLIAQAQDAQTGDRLHSDALQRAWRALEEAEDFTPEGSRLIDLQQVVSAHRTNLLQGEELSRLTPLTASQRYFAYAQKQLALAGGHDPVAAEALHCLGKTYAFISRESNEAAQTHGPLALAMHQAALMVDDQHAGAANELGVLLARYGQWDDARRVLLHAVSLLPTAEKWQNLAVVHERLGEHQFAKLARKEAELANLQLAQRGQATDPRVQWVNPAQFQQTATAPLVRQPAQEPQPVSGEKASRSGTAWKWPWMK